MSIQPGSSKLAGRHSVPEIQKKQKSPIKKILLQLLNYQGALSVGYHRQYSFYRRRLFTAYLAERGYSLDYINIIYVGGGALMARDNAGKYRSHTAYDCDLCANAKGYEFLANQMTGKKVG